MWALNFHNLLPLYIPNQYFPHLVQLNMFLLLFLLPWGVIGDLRAPRVRRIVGGEPAPQPPADAPLVFTRFAGKAAMVEGVRDFPHYVFRGLRFGLAPIGKDRFQGSS